MSRDHIIPRRTGARLYLPCGTRNWRWACQHCNNMREHAGDCAAVAIMARGVARDAGLKDRHVLAAWGFIGKPWDRAACLSLVEGRFAARRAALLARAGA